MSRIYFDSKHKHEQRLLVSIIFALISLCMIFGGSDIEQRIIGGVCLLTFGTAAVLYAIDLLNPLTKYIIPGTEEERVYKLTTEGEFKYVEDGFQVEIDDYETVTQHKVKWNKIDRVKAYKIKYEEYNGKASKSKNYTILQGIEIIYDHQQILSINETYEGYYLFITHLKDNLSLSQDWFIEDPKEPYQINEIDVYRR